MKNSISAYEKVKKSRDPNRPKSKYFIEFLFNDIVYLKGDRYHSDDASIIGGIAEFHGIPITFIGTDKGTDLDERIERNFGMPNPDGYRKALRLMEQADKFHRPIITFIDTPGAYPGVEAEARGQGEAIAKNIMKMSGFTVPIISVITGEACSGGALALLIANRIMMFENAYYSILSPEGFSSILYKDRNHVVESSEKMKLTADDLLGYQVIDRVIREELNFDNSIKKLEQILKEELDVLLQMDTETLIKKRNERFRLF